MGCGASVEIAGPTPANAVDVVADKSGKDPSHSRFDIIARGGFMPDKLRPYLSEQEYESVFPELNKIIEDRTKSAECCPPKPGLIARWVCLFLTICAILDCLIAEDYKKLDPCEAVVKKWERGHPELAVQFIKGTPNLGKNAHPHTIRVYIRGGAGGPGGIGAGLEMA